MYSRHRRGTQKRAATVFTPVRHAGIRSCHVLSRRACHDIHPTPHLHASSRSKTQHASRESQPPAHSSKRNPKNNKTQGRLSRQLSYPAKSIPDVTVHLFCNATQTSRMKHQRTPTPGVYLKPECPPSSVLQGDKTTKKQRRKTREEKSKTIRNANFERGIKRRKRTHLVDPRHDPRSTI